jgi:LmbE family N-acetylglucosaminyl deacetylase
MILGDVPASALAVFAHPDDPEVACAGTLARWVAGGCDVHLVIANAGDKGSDDPSTDPAALTATRREEARAAAAVIGLASLRLLGYPDGALENNETLRAQLIGAVREFRPDVVIAPDPTAVFFGDGYVNHHDHRMLGWAVLDVCGSMAAGPLYEPQAGPPHQVATLLLAGTLAPDSWVDIADVLAAKIEALACHASRLSSEIDGASADLLADVVEARAAQAGREAGVRYAEGFRRLSFLA